MNLNKTTNWNWNNDYTIAYAETDDPRIAAVIERDEHAHQPDYCASPPTVSGYAWWRAQCHGEDVTCGCYDEPVTWDVIRTALDHFGDSLAQLGTGHTPTERYLRVFYGTTLHLVTSTIDRYAWALVLDTPAWREHVGLDADADAGGVTSDWKAYLDGDVYGIGYAVDESRVLGGEPFDIDSADVTIEHYGCYGEDWATESALAFEGGKPDLHPMLELAIA